MEYTTRLIEEIGEQMGQELAAGLARGEGEGMIELEEEIHKVVQQMGRACMEAVLEEMAETYPPEQSGCACGEQADYRYRRQATTVTQFGQVRYRRAYYVCEACGKGHYPLDRKLGIEPGEVSPGLGSKLGVLGVQTAFGEASRLAQELLLVDVSPTTVHKQTLGFGAL